MKLSMNILVLILILLKVPKGVVSKLTTTKMLNDFYLNNINTNTKLKILSYQYTNQKIEK